MKRKPKQLNRGRYQGIWRPESKKLDIYQYDETNSPLTFYPDLIESHDFTTSTKAESWFFNEFNK